MTAKTKSAHEELAEFDERIREVERRRDETVRERGHARAAVRRAESALLEAEERRGAGEDVDVAAAEETLVLAAAEADVATAPGRPIAVRGEDGEVRLQQLPPEESPAARRWAARIRGAERAIAEAETARRAFIRQHFADLAAELVADDDRLAEELNAAWRALRAAGGAFRAQQRRWVVISRFGGVDSAVDPPLPPLDGIPDEVLERLDAGLDSPTPSQLR